MRYALPYLPLVALGNAWLFLRVARALSLPPTSRTFPIAVGTLFLWMAVFYWPKADRSVEPTFAYREYNTALEILDRHVGSSPEERGRTLVVARKPQLYIIHGYGCIRFDVANQSLEGILGEIRTGALREILVVQRVAISKGEARAGFDLDTRGYSLVTVQEERMNASTLLRVSTLKVDP